jgi:NADP-dependent 3-hydroxy acid dehydrogenase YdfG
MTARLTGTVALVTGASSGIGAATAQALIAEGASVALVARRKDRLADLAAALGDAAFPVEADITSPEAARSAVEQTVTRFGRLDTLVNNAGLMLIGPVADAPAGEWERMIQINIQGLLYVTRAALPHLTAAASDGPRGVADIVNISSTAGRVARPGNAVYSLTKFGVNAFTESLRQELLAGRVRVGVIEPGTVDTELATHVRTELRDAIARQTGTIEKLQPSDIADAVTYMVTRNRRAAVNELLIRATDQTW